MIDLKTLKSLIRLMTDNELTELDIRDKDEQVLLKRGPGGSVVPVHHMTHAPQVIHTAPAAVPISAPAPAAAPAAPEGVAIKSPMVGSCYLASSPDAEPFVRVGSHVGPETVVCLIEAMKVFNEIKADVSGTITKIVPSSGQAVEFGQALFYVKPD